VLTIELADCVDGGAILPAQAVAHLRAEGDQLSVLMSLSKPAA